jgi:hypothetical protein
MDVTSAVQAEGPRQVEPRRANDIEARQLPNINAPRRHGHDEMPEWARQLLKRGRDTDARWNDEDEEDSDDDNDDDENEEEFAEYAKTKRGSIVVVDGVGYPRVPDIKWGYAYLWLGKPPQDWSSELHSWLRTQQTAHGFTLSRAGTVMVAQAEETFRLWLGQTARGNEPPTLGQRILEAILMQVVMARFGTESPPIFKEAIEDGRARGKVILGAIFMKLQTTFGRPKKEYAKRDRSEYAKRDPTPIPGKRWESRARGRGRGRGFRQ